MIWASFAPVQRVHGPRRQHHQIRLQRPRVTYSVRDLACLACARSRSRSVCFASAVWMMRCLPYIFRFNAISLAFCSVSVNRFSRSSSSDLDVHNQLVTAAPCRPTANTPYRSAIATRRFTLCSCSPMALSLEFMTALADALARPPPPLTRRLPARPTPAVLLVRLRLSSLMPRRRLVAISRLILRPMLATLSGLFSDVWRSACTSRPWCLAPVLSPNRNMPVRLPLTVRAIGMSSLVGTTSLPSVDMAFLRRATLAFSRGFGWAVTACLRRRRGRLGDSWCCSPRGVVEEAGESGTRPNDARMSPPDRIAESCRSGWRSHIITTSSGGEGPRVAAWTLVLLCSGLFTAASPNRPNTISGQS